MDESKGGFFSESVIRFSNLPISIRKIFQKNILNLKFRIHAFNSIKYVMAGILNFKFRIVFWNVLFWDLEIWKTNCSFWKKASFSSHLLKTESALGG